MDWYSRKRTIIYIWALAVFFLAAAVAAQETASGKQASLREEGRNAITQTRSSAEFALDMFLNRMQGRGLDVAIDPDDYIIGSGDFFGIYFVSGDIDDISCRVNPEGRLFIKSVGSIEVGGLTLGQAIDKITGSVEKNYTGTGFEVSMTDFRFTRINVIGEVAHPGIYYVPAVWRASEIIDLAGGLTPKASMRHIVLQSVSKQYPVDLVRFRAIGDNRVNPMMCKGNTLQIPQRQSSDKYISVAGQVSAPGVFETTEGDRLADYLAYARGADGDPADLMVVISSENGTVTKQMACSDPSLSDYKPTPGDNVALVWKEGHEDYGHVIVMGAVTRPGRYPIDGPDFSLSDLLSRCGGISPRGSVDRIRIYRKTANLEDAELMNRVSAEFSSLDRSYTSNADGSSGYSILSHNPRQSTDPSQLMLVNGDSLFVPVVTGIVSVSGAVVSPGLVRFNEGKDVEYYLKQAGGLGIDADRARIVVIDPVTGGGIGADKAGQLYDGEMLYVPRKEYGTKP